MQQNKNYWEALRKELLFLIENQLSPLAQKYQYSDSPLESKIRWKPLVLLLGNYSSGKSTLINELVGTKIQHTGQAPTDDCFTVLTSSANTQENLEKEDDSAAQMQIEEREGRSLLGDPKYPFSHLRKHGERFAAHFRYKEIDSPLLQDFSIIDTPGMLDSITERDRGYDYQAVVGDLAEISDLILVLFDPHKAGTIKESYASLRNTLPEKTFEDRVIFVLNRIDECGSLEDLLRVYGTLCWNLSQMTGRKDIPRILLTYSPKKLDLANDEAKAHLELLANQRQELQNLIKQAPKHRLDHLATFLEHHSSRLSHLVEALLIVARRKRTFMLKLSFAGVLASLFLSTLIASYIYFVEPFGPTEESTALMAGGGVFASLYLIWQILLFKVFVFSFHRRSIRYLDKLTPLDNQMRKDSWESIRDAVEQILKNPNQIGAVSRLRKEKEQLDLIFSKTAHDIRNAISELK